jgi:hypothetical protein
MGELETSRRSAGTPAGVSAVFVVAVLAVLGGVCWCAYVAWHEPTPARTESAAVELIVTPDPALCKWLPVVAAGASLVIAVAQRVAGSNPIRFLATAGRSGCFPSSYGGHRTPDALMRTGGSQN